MTPSPRSDRPRVYADEDVDRALIEALRARGFDVLTVQITRSFGEDDPAQLERAAALGRVLLVQQRDFQRQNSRQPWRCQRTTVSGVTKDICWRQPAQNQRARIHSSLSQRRSRACGRRRVGRVSTAS